MQLLRGKAGVVVVVVVVEVMIPLVIVDERVVVLVDVSKR